jgi:NAD dependent epimerase/dehydratase
MNLINKNVLITGADGFIGSHLVESLVDKCSNLTALTMYNSFNNHGWLEHVSPQIKSNIKIISGDVRDQHFINQAVKNVDIVFHLAALIAIPYSYHAPESYVDTNVKGTLNILNACLNNQVEKALITSTSEVYGTADYVPIDEDHPKKAQSPYSATKIAADSLAKSFFCSYDLPITIVRPFNTYGPRQSARAIIPSIISQLLAGEEKIHLGDLSPTRDLNYVEDIVNGFICIAESEKSKGEEINISTGLEISMADLTKLLIQLINPQATVVQDSARLRPANSEVFRLCGCNKKLKSMTSWESKHDIKLGLEKTIAWFRESQHHYKHNLYNL